MRIALIVEKMERWRGGAETSVGEFVQHLVEAGVEVCCLTCGGQPEKCDGLEIRPVSADSGPRAWRYWRFLKAAARAARAGRFDLVHAIVPAQGADIYQPRGGTIPETLRRNLAMTRPALRRSLKAARQRLQAKQQVMLRAERRLLGRAHTPIVAAVSSYVVRQVEQHYGLRGPKVRVIFNGVNPDPADPRKRGQDREVLRRQWGFEPATVVYATVAHNFRLKGVHRLIEAAAMLRRRTQKAFGVVVAGRGRIAPYKRLARRLGVAEAVRFIGPAEDVWAVYHAADACVLNSYYDPCSRVILEALTAGLPCITTKYNGASDVIAEGETGYVIGDPDDVTDLVDRMALLLDADRRERLGRAGLALRDQVSMARHTREMLTLYEEVLRTKRTGAQV